MKKNFESKLLSSATIVVLLLGFVLLPGKVFSQLSPGDLAQVHSHLEGLSKCTECHDLGNKVSNKKCLACHKPLKARIDANKGFHVSSQVKGKDCTKCHSDHNGRKFDMLRFDKDKFKHDLTGFKLEGAHTDKKCDECHKKDFIRNNDIKKKKFSYLGLDTKCLTCHEDFHQKTLSENCTNCHNQNKFKPADKFNHNNTKFALEGKHKDVDCSKCHKTVQRNGKKFTQFAGIKFNNCTACHKDVHENKFGQNCTKCHNVNSFHEIAGLSNFNHNKTNFPLTGKHKNLDCKKCHTNGKLTQPIKHNLCSDCHKDYHEGQFVKNEIRTDCKECHTTKSFVASSYNIEDHAKTNFPLEGAHMATHCFVCHKPKAEQKWNFRLKSERCTDCHDNKHENKISQKYYPEDNCLACHNNDTWKRVKFDHNKTKFSLNGKHANVACVKCHKPKTIGGTANVIEYKLKSFTCKSCH